MLQVAVIGIPSEAWGEAVHAIVVLKEGESATESELIDHARESIAGYKVPKSVEFRTEPLPLSGAMKVLKRELRAPVLGGPRPRRQLTCGERVAVNSAMSSRCEGRRTG